VQPSRPCPPRWRRSWSTEALPPALNILRGWVAFDVGTASANGRARQYSSSRCVPPWRRRPSARCQQTPWQSPRCRSALEGGAQASWRGLRAPTLKDQHSPSRNPRHAQDVPHFSPQHPGPRHPGPRHPGPRHPGPRHPGPQHPDPQHSGPQHSVRALCPSTLARTLGPRQAPTGPCPPPLQRHLLSCYSARRSRSSTDRAARFEREGCGFKSCRDRHPLNRALIRRGFLPLNFLPSLGRSTRCSSGRMGTSIVTGLRRLFLVCTNFSQPARACCRPSWTTSERRTPVHISSASANRALVPIG
jgi:hypothetical protein